MKINTHGYYKDHIKIAPKKLQNAQTVFPLKKYKNLTKNIFVFLGSYLYFLGGKIR